MKPVVQLDPTGCGVACAAAVAGLSYRRAKSAATALGISVTDPRLWSDTTPVRGLLRHLGVRTAATETPFRSWSALPDLALLAIKWHREQGRACWHWVVFAREDGKACVLDPKKSLRQHRRTDFGRMKPKWYIPVFGRRQGRG